MTLRRVSVWALAVVLTVEFCIAGLAKFAASADWARMFLQWGYPAWCRPVVGVAEIIGGIALLVPAARRWACLVLLCIMIGAGATRFLNGPPSQVVLPVALGVMLGLLGWTSRRADRSR